MNKSTITLSFILNEIIDGKTPSDLVDDIGSFNDPIAMKKSEDICLLDDNSTDDQILDALDWVLDGDTACDLSQKLFSDLSDDHVDTAQLYIDTYTNARNQRDAANSLKESKLLKII